MNELVTDIVKTIWDSVLAMPIAEAARPAEAFMHDSTTACVQLSGAWAGVVTAQFSSGLAQASAAAMLGMEAAELSHDDIRDALGELVNMIGGNLKAMLPGPSNLSLPWVTTGDGYSLEFPHCRTVEHICLESAGHLLKVTVMKAEPDAVHEPVKLNGSKSASG